MAREYEGIAKALASRGRYGDSMMMHVNPIEVEWLDSQYPGGLPRNPDTGQPEAFLPFLAFLGPALASLAAPAAGATTAATLLAAPSITGSVLGAGLGTLAAPVGTAIGTGTGALASTGSMLGAGGSLLGAGAGGAGSGGLAANLAGSAVAEAIAANAPGLAAAAGGNALSASALPTTIGGSINSGIQSVLGTVGETILNTIATPYQFAGGSLEAMGAVPAGTWSGAAGAGAEGAALGTEGATSALPTQVTTPMSTQHGMGAMGGKTGAGQALLANQGIVQSVPSAAAEGIPLVTKVSAISPEATTVTSEAMNPAVAAELGAEVVGVDPGAMQQAAAAAESSVASEAATEFGRQALERIGELPGEAFEYVKELPGDAMNFIKENPLQAAMMGVSVGSAIAESGGGDGGDDEEGMEYDPDARLDSEWSSDDMASYSPGTISEMEGRLVSDSGLGTQDPLIQGIADVPDTGDYDYETLGRPEDFAPREDAGLAQLSAFDPSGQGISSPSAEVASISPDEYPRLQAEFVQSNPDGTIEEFERWLLDRGYGGIE